MPDVSRKRDWCLTRRRVVGSKWKYSQEWLPSNSQSKRAESSGCVGSHQPPTSIKYSRVYIHQLEHFQAESAVLPSILS
ncbi:hypothetical protein BB560_000197 [Smittium megazygosporum]|uniref:Uncharacterized protein n=1 Tax=Smittium megazygosporum TaxID=133381 RepID=A0A2T9ZL62_9FUNG|nr:hypothetical protein BB560_000197 [Smittium megazygosporum]